MIISPFYRTSKPELPECSAHRTLVPTCSYQRYFPCSRLQTNLTQYGTLVSVPRHKTAHTQPWTSLSSLRLLSGGGPEPSQTNSKAPSRLLGLLATMFTRFQSSKRRLLTTKTIYPTNGFLSGKNSIVGVI